MLNLNMPINKSLKVSNLEIAEIEPKIKINVRGKNREFFSKLGKILNIILPTEANTTTISEKYTALWLSPDEWLITSNEINNEIKNLYILEDILFQNISKINSGAITDVSDQYINLNLKGENIYEVLSSGCPYNFNNFKENKNSVVQTVLNGIDVIIYRNDKYDVNLLVRRSFSEHLWSWICDSSSRL
ncbi:MAG: sarcosine oxidase subunit gamma [Candidatus Pelagibacter sp. TMED64]|nr:sarcosine oxidase subunit gamma [Candidatus Pelagibacter sp.]OUU67123.1 MAG: sarcosine oxidase subunit gamma [Candidatus Pelagibacter sp. TMED64]|tara:strand:- start:5287 stop:5850 length:564 start_codon:yes stop_codon:yes gene_type:complete